jgi:DNA-binding MarR family transcriptional regulator
MAASKQRQAAMQWYNYLLSLVDFENLPQEELHKYNLSAPYFENWFGMTKYKTIEAKHYELLRGVSENIVTAKELATYIQHSAPATYPLLSILVIRGLLIVTHNKADKCKNYRLTPYGRRKLEEYLTSLE